MPPAPEVPISSSSSHLEHTARFNLHFFIFGEQPELLELVLTKVAVASEARGWSECPSFREAFNPVSKEFFDSPQSVPIMIMD